MLSPKLSITAVDASMHAGDVTMTAGSASSNINRLSLISDSIDVVAKRMNQAVKNSIRRIEQIELVSAGQMIQSVRNLFSVKARHSAVTAESDVKINGKRIHIG
jgi:hypothetical protein